LATIKNKITSKAKSISKKVSKNGGGNLTDKQRKRILLSVWILILGPLFLVYLILFTVPESELPSINQLENPRSDEASLVYSFDGKILGTYYIANRTKIKYKDLSPHLINALISTEDERFHSHSGIDGWALARALSGAVMGINRGGGSTITQQLAKMMFHGRPASSVARMRQKFAEWIIATRLESRYTKEEIMAMYFNEFDFLNTAVGVHSASRVYYNKLPIDLKIEEAAMLVGMAKNPYIYNPVINPDNAIKRREVVLYQMLKNGHLLDHEYDSLRVLPLTLDFHPETHNTGLAPYFREHVKQEALKIIEKQNLINGFGEPVNIYKDGLKIYTTLDAKMQGYAEWAVNEHLSNELQEAFDKDIKKNKNYPFAKNVNEKKAKELLDKEIKNSDRYKRLLELGWSQADILENFNQVQPINVFDWKSPNHVTTVEMSPLDSIKYYLKTLRTSLVAIDPQTGFVKAYVGGPDFLHFKYDYAGQAQRQVGSTIKPFVYADALEQNLVTPCTEFPNIEHCVTTSSGKLWCPGGQAYDSLMTPVYFGLAASLNNITAMLIDLCGGNNARVVQYFKAMGIYNSTMKKVPALGLGVCDVSPLNMAAAHCVFSNEGVYNKPITILRIEDASGKILYESGNKTVKVMNENVAWDVLRMMKGVTGVQRPIDGKYGGTGGRIRGSKPYAFKSTMAGKTGTTQGNADGWFIGHTPSLVTAVWVGCESNKMSFNSTNLGQGANSALPIWGYFMQKVYEDKSIKLNRGDFSSPNGGSTRIDCTVIVDSLDIEIPPANIFNENGDDF
jgi:penicillin-binding protein 1A